MFRGKTIGICNPGRGKCAVDGLNRNVGGTLGGQERDSYVVGGGSGGQGKTPSLAYEKH